MDKSSPRWKNVPPPNRNAQVTVLGTCFSILPDGSLCVDLDSISLPAPPQAAASNAASLREMPPGKRQKFASRAPTRTAAPRGEQTNAVASYVLMSSVVHRFLTFYRGSGQVHVNESPVLNHNNTTSCVFFSPPSLNFPSLILHYSLFELSSSLTRPANHAPFEQTVVEENGNNSYNNESGPSTRAKGKRKAPN